MASKCKIFKKFFRIYYALFRKYGVSVRTHGDCTLNSNVCAPYITSVSQLAPHCALCVGHKNGTCNILILMLYLYTLSIAIDILLGAHLHSQL